MFWYVVHAKPKCCQELIQFFNSQDNIYAFSPKMEKWFSSSVKKEYVLTEMYPDYIFIKTNMNHKEFKDTYEHVFHSISRIAKLLEHDGVMALTENEICLLEHVFEDKDSISHSIGNIINSILYINKGPLVGMENRIKKIDRHKRMAFLDLDIFGKMMKVPLEIVYKS